MEKVKRMRHGVLAAATIIAIALMALAGGAARAQEEQTVLGPGMYVFQTRTRSASCDDDERTGYVSSFVAPIHGVPGSPTMRMQLLNNPYFANWTITVSPQGLIVGESQLTGARSADSPTNRFEIRRDRDRFTGTGTRSYTATVGGRRQRCTVAFDALLRRIDV